MGSFRQLNVSQMVACKHNHTQISTVSHYPDIPLPHVTSTPVLANPLLPRRRFQFLPLNHPVVLSLCSLKYVKPKITKTSSGKKLLEGRAPSDALGFYAGTTSSMLLELPILHMLESFPAWLASLSARWWPARQPSDSSPRSASGQRIRPPSAPSCRPCRWTPSECRRQRTSLNPCLHHV